MAKPLELVYTLLFNLLGYFILMASLRWPPVAPVSVAVGVLCRSVAEDAIAPVVVAVSFAQVTPDMGLAMLPVQTNHLPRTTRFVRKFGKIHWKEGDELCTLTPPPMELRFGSSTLLKLPVRSRLPPIWDRTGNPLKLGTAGVSANKNSPVMKDSRDPRNAKFPEECEELEDAGRCQQN
jgi:hypothetical protein